MTHDVLVVGGTVAGCTTLDCPVTSAVFDDDTNMWTLTTDAGQSQTRILLARDSPLIPWIPNLPGRNQFRGESFHATAIAPDFDPAAQRIAVIGADAGAGRLIGKLTRSGAAVTVFPLPPRRVVRQTRGVRRYLRRRPELVTSPVDALTASGIRTADGTVHEADTIVFGTGFAVSGQRPALIGTGGLTLQQTWRDGTEPYLGVAMHGFPNYFMLASPDADTALLELISGHPRIEVRRSTQQVFNERIHLGAPSPRLVASGFDLSSPGGTPDDSYDGPATLIVAGSSQQVQVRLAGRIDPIDGRYHWQGTIFDELPTDLMTKSRSVELAVSKRSAAARITEKTPQGTHSIAGVGAPPFSLPDIELTAPHR